MFVWSWRFVWSLAIIIIVILARQQWTSTHLTKIDTVLICERAGACIWIESKIQRGEIYHWTGPHDQGEWLGLNRYGKREPEIEFTIRRLAKMEDDFGKKPSKFKNKNGQQEDGIGAVSPKALSRAHPSVMRLHTRTHSRIHCGLLSSYTHLYDISPHMNTSTPPPQFKLFYSVDNLVFNYI